MPITEAERHDMHRTLEEVLGPDQANTLMEHLPPVGWADVATKRDLDQLREALRGEMAHLGDRIENRLLRDQRMYVFALLSAFVAIMGLMLALA
ncbi:MAG: hypothetical protein ACR2OH_10835 [Microthrixaceae bacterium]